jgi:hypothetical protein
MAEPAVDLIHELTRLDPKSAAELLLEANRDDAGWLDAFAEQLDRQRNAAALQRVLRTWDLNQSDVARIFGISRQAMSKWVQQGVPAERAAAVADLGAATDLLSHHLKRDRIPAVVRRDAPALQDRSLLGLLERGEFRAVLAACRDMFEFGEAHL